MVNIIFITIQQLIKPQVSYSVTGIMRHVSLTVITGKNISVSPANRLHGCVVYTKRAPTREQFREAPDT